MLSAIATAVWWTRRRYRGFGKWAAGGPTLILSLLLVLPIRVLAQDEPSAPDPLPRTWGLANLDIVPAGHKMGPNGVPYDPVFSLGLLLSFVGQRSNAGNVLITVGLRF
jgi:hypothetical protein